MWRLALALSLLILAHPARAQLPSFLSCIDQSQSWSNSFSAGLISSVTYIVSMPFAPAPPVVLIRLRTSPTTMGWLIGIGGPPDDPTYHRSGFPSNVNILISFPSNVASQYQKLTNAQAQFASNRRTSHELLLIDGGSFCPLLAEDAAFSTTGYALWTH